LRRQEHAFLSVEVMVPALLARFIQLKQFPVDWVMWVSGSQIQPPKLSGIFGDGHEQIEDVGINGDRH